MCQQVRNILLAGLFGYLLGILFAPKKGSELRDNLKDFVLDLEDLSLGAATSVTSKGQEMLAKAEPKIRAVGQQARDLGRKASASLSQAVARS